MSSMRTLWYFADPMCSWCWGFAPVVSAIRERYADRLGFELVMGGLRPGMTEPVTPPFREEILHHWHEVQRRSGQPFRFDGAFAQDDFVYDTEPPSRAVIAVAALDATLAFPYFKSVQAAFYADGRDVTKPDELATLARAQGLDTAAFLARFDSDEIRQRTGQQFRETANAGIRGFPTVVLQDESGVSLLTLGYQPLAPLTPTIDAWLAGEKVGA
jgi:putative protein-disulfide isomerase